MLAGFERPSQGVITLDGKSVDRLPPYERNIGMVFQNYALFPHMSVEDNVAFPLSVRKFPKAEIGPRVTRALEMVRLRAASSDRDRPSFPAVSSSASHSPARWSSSQPSF